MPFRTIPSNTQAAMTPVNPEDKCFSRKRLRPLTTTSTIASPCAVEDEDDELLAAAALFDCDFVDMDVASSTEEDYDREHLKRLCVETEDTHTKPCDEVRTLQTSVNSMAKDVALAAQKINELRDLIARSMEQRHHEHINC